MLVCPAGESCPGGCYDATFEFTFPVAEAKSAETVKKIEESLPPYITNGRLAEILEVVNPDSPVKILGLIVRGEATAPTTQTPTIPPTDTPEKKVQVEEKVLVQIGLEEAGLQAGAYIDDLVEALKQLAIEVFDGSVSASLGLNIELGTSGTYVSSKNCFDDDYNSVLSAFSVSEQRAPREKLSPVAARTQLLSSILSYWLNM